MPSQGRGDIHLLVKTTDNADPKAAIEGPPIEQAILAKLEATSETPIHPYDQDLDIPAQDVTSAFVSLFLLFQLTFVLER